MVKQGIIDYEKFTADYNSVRNKQIDDPHKRIGPKMPNLNSK